MPKFCIQEHLAKKAGLHWDLRVEVPGEPEALICYIGKRHWDQTTEPKPQRDSDKSVLASWAIPKAKLPAKGERLFAIKTEDHPFEYLTFEGEIGEGYGAGIIKLVQTGDCKVIQGKSGWKLELGELGIFKLIPFKKGYLVLRLN